MTLAPAGALVALAASAWLLRREGTWDTYRTPLFWPFLFAAGAMAVFSTTDAAAEPRGWRALVVRVACVAAALTAVAALVAARNPIYDLHSHDVAALAVLQAASIAAAGIGTAWGEHLGPGTWIRTAWCVAASMLALALVPPVLLWLH